MFANITMSLLYNIFIQMKPMKLIFDVGCNFNIYISYWTVVSYQIF